MRHVVLLLLLALFLFSGCETFVPRRDAAPPDYKPSAPTREMRF